MQKSFSREYERSTKLSIEMAVATVYTASVEVISGLFLVIVSLKVFIYKIWNENIKYIMQTGNCKTEGIN